MGQLVLLEALAAAAAVELQPRPLLGMLLETLVLTAVTAGPQEIQAETLLLLRLTGLPVLEATAEAAEAAEVCLLLQGLPEETELLVEMVRTVNSLLNG